MKATKEQAAYFLPFVQALADGRDLQFKTKSDPDTETCWVTLLPRHGSADWFNEDDFLNRMFRIKPEPKLRPWKAEEVPVGAMVKSDGGGRYVILGADTAGIAVPRGDGVEWRDYLITLNSYTHSTDGGKTWLPCGVQEP